MASLHVSAHCMNAGHISADAKIITASLPPGKLDKTTGTSSTTWFWTWNPRTSPEWSKRCGSDSSTLQIAVDDWRYALLAVHASKIKTHKNSNISIASMGQCTYQQLYLHLHVQIKRHNWIQWTITQRIFQCKHRYNINFKMLTNL